MTLKKLSISLAVVTSMVGTTAQAENLHLDGQQIESLFPGQYEGKVKGFKVQVSADQAGKLEGQAFGLEDRGKWFIRGNELCVSWRLWTMGQAQCWAISQQGKWLVASNASGKMFRFRLSN